MESAKVKEVAKMSELAIGILIGIAIGISISFLIHRGQ
jgi:hypothetical protein